MTDPLRITFSPADRRQRFSVFPLFISLSASVELVAYQGILRISWMPRKTSKARGQQLQEKFCLIERE